MVGTWNVKPTAVPTADSMVLVKLQLTGWLGLGSTMESVVGALFNTTKPTITEDWR